MNAYLDITLLPSGDIGHYFLWEKVFQQIHLGFVEIQNMNSRVAIGIALPGYSQEKCRLGDKLRLLAENETVLANFNAAKRLQRMDDYVHLTRIREVPASVSGYACYQRRQAKPTREQLAKRKSRREGIDLLQAETRLGEYQPEPIQAPYINVKSQSSGQRFKLFVHKLVVETPKEGKFGSYGLSARSTVPDFDH